MYYVLIRICPHRISICHTAENWIHFLLNKKDKGRETHRLITKLFLVTRSMFGHHQELCIVNMECLISVFRYLSFQKHLQNIAKRRWHALQHCHDEANWRPLHFSSLLTEEPLDYCTFLMQTHVLQRLPAPPPNLSNPIWCNYLIFAFSMAEMTLSP